MELEYLLPRFKLDKVLASNPQTKSIVLLGRVDEEYAIISLEKSHFALIDDVYNIHQSVLETQLIQNNDVYYWAGAELHQELPNEPGAKLNVIYPATETHIRKYSPQKYHYILETPEMYEKYVIPYIETMKGDRIKWVYNILFEGKESETFVHHEKHPDTGFVLLPDMKWDRISMDSLYLCAIVNRTDISSIRDLNGSHISYLQDLKQKIVSITSEKFPVEKDGLRVFVHYQPSYYHFHIHVVTLKHEGLGDGINIGKAILLDDVIENLKIAGDYYQKKTIGYVLGENHGLWQIDGYQNAN